MPELIRGPMLTPFGQKIEAVKSWEIVPVYPSLIRRRTAIEVMKQLIGRLPIGRCELHSQEQTQLKISAFEPQPSVYQN